MSTAGNTSLFGNLQSLSGPNAFAITRIQVAGSGTQTISSISAGCRGQSGFGNRNYRVGLCADAAGVPGALIAGSVATAVAIDAAAQFIAATVSCTVAANAFVWVLIAPDSSGSDTLQAAINSGTTNTIYKDTTGKFNFTAFAGTFSNDTTIGSFADFSAFVTYSVPGGLIKIAGDGGMQSLSGGMNA